MADFSLSVQTRASFVVLDFDSMCMGRKLMGKKIGLVQT